MYRLYSVGRNRRMLKPKPLPKPTIRVDKSEVHDNNDNIVEEHFMVDVDGNIIGKYLFIVLWNICGKYLWQIFGRNISKEYLYAIIITNISNKLYY